ncbi:MAG: hypothetical protein KY475_18065 [Planctomycetes bacterium]|nr:hypothetical protein [Planctomycetota bacterium]
MVAVEVLLDVPQGVEIRGYERIEEGHAFEVSWELPESCTCQKCGRSGVARIEYASKVQVIRDLEVWGSPLKVLKSGLFCLPSCFEHAVR